MQMGLGIFLSNNRVRPTLNPITDLPTLVAWFDPQDPTNYTESGGNLITVVNKKSSVVWRRPTLTGSPNLTFANVGSADTITRDAGSWIADGFTVGDTYTGTGAVNAGNNVTNGAIVGVTATVLTMGSLVSLVNEGPVGGCTALGSVPMMGYSATALGTKPGFTNDGTKGILSTEAAVLAVMQGATSGYIALVGKVNTADSSMAFIGAGSNANATNANRYFGTNTTSAGVWIAACRNNAAASVNAESAAGSDTNVNIHEFFWTPTTASIAKNGAAADPNAAAANTGAASPTRVSLGCRGASTPNVLLNGAIGDVLICSTVPDAAARAAIRIFLGDKYGVVTA